MDDHERGRALPPALRPLFPDGGAGRALSTPLPAGSVVWPDPDYPQRQTIRRPAFWLSDGPVPGDLWERLAAEHQRSGLWPLLLDESAQPWAAGQVAPEPPSEITAYDPVAFMSEVWSDWAEQQPDDEWFEALAPFGRQCPGPALRGVPLDDPDAVAARHARTLAGRGMSLGLAAVQRGADAPAAMGWQGALNHNEWTAPLAAVLRGWEERFGARVVGVGFNTLELSVAAPPVALRHALHVAAEHWTFCPDSVFQGPGTLAAYAEEICGSTSWSFWWD